MTDTVTINVALVRTLIARQFPQWAHLPIRGVVHGGWDNRTFHLGEEMTVRLPSAEGYAHQVRKEQRWLPRLAPHLPVPIPAPLGLGAPDAGYPWPWSVYAWLEGETLERATQVDRLGFAADVAGFLRALGRIDATGAPEPGPHNFHRGGSPAFYDTETRRAISILAGEIDAEAAIGVWEAALASTWAHLPRWFHGDVAPGNLLIRNGRLGAVIDFGCSGVGDPACDLVIAWTTFDDEQREVFRAGMELDHGTWARGRGWAIWKALIVAAGATGTPDARQRDARRVIDIVIADHRARGTSPSARLHGEASDPQLGESVHPRTR